MCNEDYSIFKIQLGSKFLTFKYRKYLETGRFWKRVFKWLLTKTILRLNYLKNQPTFGHSKTGHVWYWYPHCIPMPAKHILLRQTTKSRGKKNFSPKNSKRILTQFFNLPFSSTVGFRIMNIWFQMSDKSLFNSIQKCFISITLKS